MDWELCALCAVGSERVLGNELRKLGLPLSPGARAGMVPFRADRAGIARAHLWLRTAERILLVAARFPAPDFEALFEGMRSAPWEEWCRRDARIAFQKLRLSGSALSSVPAVQSVAQKAVYERLGAAYGGKRLPETGATVGLRLYIDRDQAMAGIDLSGEPLHRRGYRRISGPAPLKETIAAALILKSGWKRRLALHDPFCGTGTIPIEAALFAYNVPPGAARSFAFRSMPGFDEALFAEERAKALALADFGYSLSITGTDGDEAMVRAAMGNAAAAAGLFKAPAGDPRRPLGILFERKSMEECRAAAPEGLIVANPPYGERIRDLAYAENLYRQMRHLRRDFPGWGVAVITTHPDFPEHFGAEPTSVQEIQNGQERSFVYLFSAGAAAAPVAGAE
jgi:putative N6-adenine-specific DNA methylase